MLTITESSGLGPHVSILLIGREGLMRNVVGLAAIRIGISLTVNIAASRFSRSRASQPRSALQSL